MVRGEIVGVSAVVARHRCRSSGPSNGRVTEEDRTAEMEERQVRTRRRGAALDTRDILVYYCSSVEVEGGWGCEWPFIVWSWVAWFLGWILTGDMDPLSVRCDRRTHAWLDHEYRFYGMESTILFT